MTAIDYGKAVPYDPATKTYAVDELFVWPDLWVTAHVWAEGNGAGFRISWLNFRLIEHEAQEGGSIFYPTDSQRRPSPSPTTDARMAVDAIADGFVKWDGCSEISLDNHFCGVSSVVQTFTALMRLFFYCTESLGFEECDPRVDVREPT